MTIPASVTESSEPVTISRGRGCGIVVCLLIMMGGEMIEGLNGVASIGVEEDAIVSSAKK
jgi:hypothetical protein